METSEVQASSIIFPEPEEKDFDEEVNEEERKHFLDKYKDLNLIKNERLHCTACDRHIGCAPKSDSRMRMHPMLRTLVCRPCFTFYNSGEFERGDDGSELYCRWCGQGGQVYCCSVCPHVFCAKCIKRNMGAAMIREIESTDDWKCFKCTPRGLWDLRAQCWAILRYCDLRNKMIYSTDDEELKERYTKECAIDDSECCKQRKKSVTPSRKAKEEKKEEKKDEEIKNKVLAKIPSGIKVKKFATISVDAVRASLDKKGVKRPASPMRSKPLNLNVRAPIPIAPFPRPISLPSMVSSISMPVLPQAKKVRFPNPSIMSNMPNSVGNMLEPRRYQPRHTSKPRNHSPNILRPYQPQSFSTPYNGYNHFVNSDNINLSLENLTHGLDMNAMATPPVDSTSNDELVCTPDFPLEPLCEVTEDNGDDDVECITPGPIVPPKPALKPQRNIRNLPDVSPDNIVQMTENDVTVNAVTGGLKFRVDPQTLSSNKMYRLPDGRIFAINANPNMPGGYSATIVAVSETGSNPPPASLRGTTYAANLSTVMAPVPPPLRKFPKKTKDKAPTPTSSKTTPSNSRTADMKTPVEWYRYNLLDSIDALQYSVTRLERLKKEADTQHLRTRTIEEMIALHSKLERHLRTSTSRFQEIRENLNRGFTTYLREKGAKGSEDEDDDDVEILNDSRTEDPIFIDENSNDSNHSDNDVTALSSEPNDSGEHNGSKNVDPLANSEVQDVENTKLSNEDAETQSTDQSVAENDPMDVDSQGKTNTPGLKEDKKPENGGDNNEEIQPDIISSKVVSDEKSEVKSNNKKGDTDKFETKKDEVKDRKDDVIDEKTDVTDDKDDVTDDKDDVANETDDVANEKDDDINEKEDGVVNEKDKDTSDKSDLADDKFDATGEHDAATKEKDKENTNANKETDDENERNVVDSTDNVLEDFPQNNCENSENNSISEENTSRASAEKKDDEMILGLNNDDSLLGSDMQNEDKSKLNGNSKEEAMEVDGADEADSVLKGNDNEIQMSDEMIDNLLADDGPPDELTAELQKFTERTIDSLADTDLMGTEFN